MTPSRKYDLEIIKLMPLYESLDVDEASEKSISQKSS
jgi:hypothetical protein